MARACRAWKGGISFAGVCVRPGLCFSEESSYDRTGGNGDSWPVPAGGTKEVFNASGPGVITHIWFTIAAESSHHLKEIILRILLGRKRQAQRGNAGG